MADSPKNLKNPFVGPRSIQFGEALYGRDAEVEELFDIFLSRRIVLLHAPSGAGKSSLVAAGLIPKLQEARFDVWKTIRVNLDPSGLAGVSPDTNRRYLLSALLSLEEELPQERRRSPAELAGMDLRDYLETRRKDHKDRPVVLVFDQFEEILTTAPHAVKAKQVFFDAVGEVLDGGTLWALFIIREDYLGALAPYREKLPTQLSNTFRLDLLGIEGAREAAVKLAEAGGRSFPGVERLITELRMVTVQKPDGSFDSEKGEYVEPVLLQVVCYRLWKAMPAEDDSIDAEDIGKVSEALGDYYTDSVEKIAAEDVGVERKLREWVGRQLIVAGIRSQVRMGKGQTEGLDNTLIDGLKNSYLVRADTRAGVTWFELSHDRLVDAVTKNNEAWEKAHLHVMQVQARLWAQGNSSPTLLLSAGALVEAQQWAKQNEALLTESERKFLAISAKTRAAEAKAKRRSRVFTAVLMLLLVLAMVSAGWAWVKTGEAEANAQEAEDNLEKAEANAQEARANAQEAEANLKTANEAKAGLEKAQAGLIEALDKADKATAAAEQQATAARIAQKEAVSQAERARIAKAKESARELLASGRPVPGELVLATIQNPYAVWGWWALMKNLVSAPGQLEVVLSGHEAKVRSAAWSPDGTRIVTASDDGTARVWRSDGAGQPDILDRDKSRGDVRSAVWSPNGDWIVTASNRTAWVWHSDGTEAVVLNDHKDVITSAAWSPNGTQIITTSWDGTARVWNLDGTKGTFLKDHTGGIWSASWSPDGTQIVTASRDKTARVWRSDGTGESVSLPHEGEVYSAAWSPKGGTRIVTVSADGKVRVWHSDGSDKGNPVVLTHTGGVSSAAWSPDETQIVTTSWDGTVKVWRSDGSNKNNPMVLRGHAGTVYTAAWSPNGERIVTASADGTARVWWLDGVSEPVVFRGHKDEVLSATWSPDGTRIVTTSDDQTTRVWQVEGANEQVTHYQTGVLSAAWKPDSTQVVVGLANGEVRVWLSFVMDESVLIGRHKAGVWSVAWNDNETQIVTGSADGTARIWYVDGLHKFNSIFRHEGEVYSTAWSPDGTKIVTASKDGTVRVWQLADDSTIPVYIEGHQGAVHSAAWSGDGTRIVTASEDNTARVWRLDGTEEAVPRDHTGWVYSAAWSPDGTRIVTASADNNVRIWQSDGTGMPVILEGHKGAVFTAAWSPDGTQIVTASMDGTARVWLADEKREIISLNHETWVRSAAWSPDGTRIVTASADGTARIWLTPTGMLSLVPPLCLSPAQRELYLVETPTDARANYEACERSHGRTPLDDPPDL